MKATKYEGNKTVSVVEGTNNVPKNNEVTVKIAYSGICGTDMHIFHGVMDGRVKRPHIMGHECSGTVEAVGSDVVGIEVGEKVVVRPLDPCGECYACKNGMSHICYNLNFMGVDTAGSMQSYWTVPDHTIYKIPEEMDLKLAALVEPLSVAVHDVRRSGIGQGDKALVIGGGPIGILCALAAKSFGAEVLLSEVNESRLTFAENVGIKTVNPAKQDLLAYIDEWTDGVRCDACFEVSGSKPGAMIMMETVKTRGKVVLVGIFGQPTEVNLHRMWLREVELLGARVYEDVDYKISIALLNEGKYPFEKVITKVASIDQIQKVFEELDGPTENMKVLLQS